jgi:VanZ family protein
VAAVASRTARLWIPVLLWAGIIFAFSSIPSLNTGLGVWDLVLRKLAHAAVFGVLAVLIFRAVGRLVPAFLGASAYAVTDELHQSFVSGRQASVRDWAVDTAGAAIGLLVVSALRTRR